MKFPGEAARLQDRADLFNALKHTQGGPAVNQAVQTGVVNAGRVTGTRLARQGQLLLRFFV